MKAIILVAGRGVRLKPLTDSMPKCLTEVNGKPILTNMLEQLEKAGVKEAILVVGYLKDKIKLRLGNNFRDMKLTYAENSIYDKTNNSYSLWVALKNLDEDVLILEGDVFFEYKLLRNFLNNKSKNVTLVEKYNPNLDGTFLKFDKNNIVTEWVHMKDRPSDFTREDKYKTVNFHKFSKEFINQWVMPELKKHVEEEGGTEPQENIFKRIIQKGAKIHASEADGRWFEIDDITELKTAEKIFS